MIQKFDYFDNAERPPIVLCNPNTDRLYSLGDIKEIKVTLNYNALSELSFTCPSQVNGVSLDYYPLITYRRLVYIGTLGYFLINEVTTINEGGVNEYKQVVAKSWEVDFNYKRISKFAGTYKFYDFVNPSPTLLGTVLTFMPGWSVGTISTSLLALYRTFDVSDNSLYNFLQTDVENAYQCVFYYDFLNKTINAYTPGEASQLTDVFLSFNNLVKKTDIKEISDQLITALSVYGGNNLDIAFVNPLGTSTIYNLDYFTTTGSTVGTPGFMSASLVTSVTNWKNLIIANQPTYANYLTQYENANAILITQESDLAGLQALYDTQVGIQNARIRQGLSYGDINATIAGLQAQITSKNADIAASNVTLAGIQAQLVAINTALSFNTNFSAAQQVELLPFLIGNTYNNTGFTMTDSMTNVEIQQQAQALYDQAQTVLAKVSQPKFTFDIEASNFLTLKEFQTFTNQLSLGSIINFQIASGSVVYPIVLSMQFQYDDPTQFKMTFGNRLRLDNSSFIFSDIYGDSVKTSITSKFNSEQWISFDRDWKDPVSTFLSSSLNAANNAVISNSNQEVLINQNGINLRLSSGSGTYDPHQMRIINNMIVMSSDNFNTAQMAMGQLMTSSGSVYGISAPLLAGTLLAGNQLLITNANNSFTVDGNGAVMSNASLTFTTKNSNNIIKLDPDVGIMIQQVFPNSGSVIKDLFYVDINGNLIMAGNGTFSGSILASSGKIGGWTITETGIQDDWGNYIDSDQNIVLGKLSIHGGTAVFDGNIYARNLGDQIQTGNLADLCVTNAKIANLNAGKITAGTMLADRIYGGTIRWGGSYNNPKVTMGLTGTGLAEIDGYEGILLSTLNGIGPAIDIHPLQANGYGGLIISGGVSHTPIYLGGVGDSLYVDSSKLYVLDIESVPIMNYSNGVSIGPSGNYTTKVVEKLGSTRSINVGFNAPSQTLKFVKGILVDYDSSGYPNSIDTSNNQINGVIPPTNSVNPNIYGHYSGWIYQFVDEQSTIWYHHDTNYIWSADTKMSLPWVFAGLYIYDAIGPPGIEVVRYNSTTHNGISYNANISSVLNNPTGIVTYLSNNGVTGIPSLNNTILTWFIRTLCDLANIPFGIGSYQASTDPENVKPTSPNMNGDYSSWVDYDNQGGDPYNYPIRTAPKWSLYIKPE